MARGNEDRAILRSRNFPRHHTMLKILRSVEVSATSREHAEDISAVTTAGVDVRDVNEHHLQAALGVSLHAIQGHAALSGTKEPITCIPVPDFKDVSRLYPALAQEERRWNDSFNYLQSSDTVEQSIEDGLVDGFTYFMDEKDAQWLTHTNNCNMESKVPDEDVPQIKQECDGWLCGPIDAVQSGGRIAPRASLSCTGKSQNAMSGIRISEDHFELVMGIFEKVTADVLKESGGDHRDSVQADEGAVAGIPPFSTYEETFATKLTPVLFATYRVPKWVPESPVLTAMARTIFPHWIKRRTMPRGLEVLPGLHLKADELDAYGCFRRRDDAALKMRSRRKAQVNQLLQLDVDLAKAMDISNRIVVLELRRRRQIEALKSKALARYFIKTPAGKTTTLVIAESERRATDASAPLQSGTYADLGKAGEDVARQAEEDRDWENSDGVVKAETVQTAYQSHVTDISDSLDAGRESVGPRRRAVSAGLDRTGSLSLSRREVLPSDASVRHISLREQKRARRSGGRWSHGRDGASIEHRPNVGSPAGVPRISRRSINRENVPVRTSVPAAPQRARLTFEGSQEDHVVHCYPNSAPAAGANAPSHPLATHMGTNSAAYTENVNELPSCSLQ